MKFKPAKYIGGWTNILGLKFGERSMLIGLKQDSNQVVEIGCYFNGFMFRHKKVPPVGHWTILVVCKRRVYNTFYIKINGTEVHSKKKSGSKDFESVKVFASTGTHI